MDDKAEKESAEYYAQIERAQGGGPMLGATLRDQIAIEVMKLVSRPILDGADYFEDNPVERIARISYALADAMLAERAK